MKTIISKLLREGLTNIKKQVGTVKDIQALRNGKVEVLEGFEMSDLKKIGGFDGLMGYSFADAVAAIDGQIVAWWRWEDRAIGAFEVRKDLRGAGIGKKVIYSIFEPGEEVGIFMNDAPDFWKSVSKEFEENGYEYGVDRIVIKDKEDQKY
jgi:hypothetical protein